MNAVTALSGDVFTLQSYETERHWCLIEPYFARLASRFPYDIDPALVREDLRTARKQLWGYHDGARVVGVCVTEIQHPVCWIRAACSDSSESIDVTLAAIEQWAKSIGCDRIRLAGRRGWQRRLRKYQPVAVTLEKVL